jgi:hypothetical protein
MLAAASSVIAKDSIKAAWVEEDFTRDRKACLATEVEPCTSGFREVARGDVMIDLRPLLSG